MTLLLHTAQVIRRGEESMSIENILIGAGLVFLFLLIFAISAGKK
ncbi:hypothetical protein HBHAL_2060 [Halobacillus halophilus DSM 2266]|uniref:Uncharacterized protein n=1 Tax=Halobacillus halophilus (strain ATCC 35676 / DSM 2266 / JCM 20832 / KCTC 3685 / LMG 17431 / NBRC 102448 / NCIMB 2269) TaxID=866895 RepID=I0JJV2_HALH3|nr:hypothetical protein HBHAL_2060 [Halobacillus halophilus DSM 2266]